jgi:hypothetical protein
VDGAACTPIPLYENGRDAGRVCAERPEADITLLDLMGVALGPDLGGPRRRGSHAAARVPWWPSTGVAPRAVDPGRER